jgi:hypothetical protein
MAFYIFKCSNARNLYGVTDEQTGAKLPKDVCTGEWKFQRQIAESRTKATVVQDIRKQGYHVSRADVKVTVMAERKPPTRKRPGRKR